MNITLSIDDELVERARAVAAGRGKSLNQMIREYLEVETGVYDGKALRARLEEMWATSPGHSGGERFRREDVYEERMK